MGKLQKNQIEKEEVIFSDKLLKYFIDKKNEHGMFYKYMEALGLATKRDNWSVVMLDEDELLKFRKNHIFKTPYEEVDEMIKNEQIPFNTFRKIEKEAEKKLYKYIYAKEQEVKNLNFIAQSFPQLQ